jgi:hypothetical protein
MTVAWSLAGLALTVCVVGWWRVVRLWRALPRPDDDEQGWWRRRGGDDPSSGPDAGPGGITFDWLGFEREFWAHVERVRRAEFV